MDWEECTQEIGRMLRFFVDTGNFGYVDRIGNALVPDIVETALMEAIRALRSLYGSARTDERGFKCVEHDGRCVTLPPIPGKDVVTCFLEAVRADIGYARRAAIYALAWHAPRSREE